MWWWDLKQSDLGIYQSMIWIKQACLLSKIMHIRIRITNHICTSLKSELVKSFNKRCGMSPLTSLELFLKWLEKVGYAPIDICWTIFKLVRAGSGLCPHWYLLDCLQIVWFGNSVIMNLKHGPSMYIGNQDNKQTYFSKYGWI